MKKQQLVKSFVQYFEIRNGDIYSRITIEFKKLEEGFLGFCFPDRNGIVIQINKSLNEAEMISTLFHELVHAKQFDSGILQWNSDNGDFHWRGELTKLPYSKQPWEKQAYRLQDKMVAELQH